MSGALGCEYRDGWSEPSVDSAAGDGDGGEVGGIFSPPSRSKAEEHGDAGVAGLAAHVLTAVFGGSELGRSEGERHAKLFAAEQHFCD